MRGKRRKATRKLREHTEQVFILTAQWREGKPLTFVQYDRDDADRLSDTLMAQGAVRIVCEPVRRIRRDCK